MAKFKKMLIIVEPEWDEAMDAIKARTTISKQAQVRIAIQEWIAKQSVHQIIEDERAS